MSEQEELVLYYRYIDKCYAGCSATEWGSEDYYISGPHLELQLYRLVKKTPKGAWLARYYKGMELVEPNSKRWVSDTATKRLAHPTKEEALHSFICRKRRQAAIYQERMNTAERAKALGEQELKNLEKERGPDGHQHT